MSDILQPCPSCGSPRLETAERRHKSGHRHAFVICPKCGLRGPWGKTWQEAEAAWNDLPRVLRWTKEPPTKPGWYWHHMPPAFGAVIEYVDPEDWERAPVGEWAGPIPNIDK